MKNISYGQLESIRGVMYMMWLHYKGEKNNSKGGRQMTQPFLNIHAQ